MSLIGNFGKVAANLHSLTWEIGSVVGTFQTEDKITCSAYSPENNLVLLLAQSGEATCSNRLVALKENGEIKFDVTEPSDYWFYYLASHVNYEMAVVCRSKGNALDWYFSVDPDSGELHPLNRSY